MDTSDNNSKKIVLEELSKEEIINKYRGLLSILQKAKQSQHTLVEENKNLKKQLETNTINPESLENLKQQNLNLITSLEDVENDKDVICNKLKESEVTLSKSQNKIENLQIQNESYQKQINRLTEENEQLLFHLDTLEKQTEELKAIGLQQQQQLLQLEKSDITKEIKEKDEIIDSLTNELKDFKTSKIEIEENQNKLLKDLETLENKFKESESTISQLKCVIEEKTKLNQSYMEASDDINTELYKNRALVEKLKQDILTLTNKLSDNQIVSSGVTSDLQNINEKLKNKLKFYHTKIVKFARDVKILKQQKDVILDISKDYIGQVQLWEAQLKEFSSNVLKKIHQLENEKIQVEGEVEKMKIEFNTVEEENNNLKTLIKSLETSKYNTDKNLNEEINLYIGKLDEHKNQIETAEKERHFYKQQSDNLSSEIKILNDRHEKEKSNLTTKLENIQAQNIALNNNLQQLERELKLCEEHQIEIVKLQDTQSCLKNENVELLKEMNEMNQVLKERGETISVQQKYCEELLSKIHAYELEFSMLTEKQTFIKSLEEEIKHLKSSSNQCSVDENQTVQETLRMKDEEIVQLKSELAALREKQSCTLPDSLQDSSYAESETMSTSTISRADEQNRLKDLEGSWEERYGKLRTLALKLKGKIRELTKDITKEQNEKLDLQQKLTNSLKSIQNLQAEYDKLADDLDSNKKLIKEYSKKLDVAALEISNNKQHLANNDEVITKLKSDFDMLTKEKISTDQWKKQVSNKVQNFKKELEAHGLMKKDLEKQICKLQEQVEAKDKLLKEEMDKHKSTRNCLQESHNECKKQSVLNLEMQDYERSLKDVTQKMDKKQDLINKLKNQLDTQKTTVNAIKEQNRLLEEQIQNEARELSNAHSEIQAYKKTINDLELIIAQKDDKIQTSTRDVETCRSEIEELSTQLMKVVSENQKIQTVLKSEKEYLRSQNLGLEQKLREIEETLKSKEEELKIINDEYLNYKVRAQSVLRQNQTRDVGLEEKLSEEVASFKAHVSVLTSKLNECESQIGILKNENTKLNLKKDQLETIQQNLRDNLEELRQQNNALTIKQEKVVVEHAETIRGLKVHSDTLAQCYRKQIAEQEVRHNREIIELQSKIEKTSPSPDVPTLIPPTIPREQGEGSESVETVGSINTYPVPLDQLLSTDSDQSIDFVKKQVVENEAKVAHLTALLADTEQDLAKHVQMNKLLKEEIRRQQRSVEREQHAENLEYLKNVVFKFLTLNSGDERSRLVPVLNTILKFSPEEYNKLNIIAKGDMSSKSWSTYLPIWPSTGKPQS